MPRIVILLAVAMCVAGSVAAAFEAPPEIRLWPQGMPEPVIPADPPEKVEKGADGIQRRTNVSQPRLFVYEPPAGVKRTGAAVIVVPGGGFGVLADEHEGSDAAEWLAKQGIVGFQLAHRAPTNKHPMPNAGPAQDLQKAVIEVRRHAAQFQVDPKKVGILGFSAGGQVTLVAASNDRKFPGEEIAESHKPDFLLLLYAYQIYDPMTKGLRADILLDGGLPPTFIAQMGDDGGSLPQGSTLLYLELINRKIPAEIHIYEKGGHGFGMRSRPGATGPTDWQLRAIDWLRLREYATAP
ncbi:MAG: alpha/beta hydrolase [Planctomycetaceae bacterium]|nr:alpha/beta hydrolase [Planctomycetaceae bacterium]